MKRLALTITFALAAFVGIAAAPPKAFSAWCNPNGTYVNAYGNGGFLSDVHLNCVGVGEYITWASYYAPPETNTGSVVDIVSYGGFPQTYHGEWYWDLGPVRCNTWVQANLLVRNENRTQTIWLSHSGRVRAC